MRIALLLLSALIVGCACPPPAPDAIPYTRDCPTAEPRHTTMDDHWRRACMACAGEWDPDYQLGRDSDLKPGPFECTHGLKNGVIEWLRCNGIWNRKARDPRKPDGYTFPGPCPEGAGS